MRHEGQVGTVTDSSRRAGERGIALIWAILIMLVVLGTVTVSVGMSMIRTDETRDESNRTRSSLWLQAASDDLMQRLQSREIGYDLLGGGPAPAPQDQIIVVPRPTGTSALMAFPNGGTSVARPLIFTEAGTTFRGWYQVLPTTPATNLPWTAVLRRNPVRPDLQGSIEMTVRVWEQSARAEPVVAKLVFRRASFSRFSLLSDDRLQLGGVGTVRPGGYIHTNNAQGLSPAISVAPPAQIHTALRVTTTRGAISPKVGCGAKKCVENVGDVVEFGAATRAFQRTFQQSTSGPPGVASYRQNLPDNVANGRTSVWVVDLGSCASGIAVWHGTMALRNDTSGVPTIDDNQPLAVGASQGCINVAEGGGAILFNGDVVVRGNRTSRNSVTIMAQRRIANDPLLVRLNVDNDVANTYEPNIRFTAPANIYLLQNGNGGGVGSALGNLWGPVGVVAEGGVYLPSYAMRPGQPNNTMRVRNVAAMAANGEIAYGPSIISVAADNNQAGLGMSPAAAQASPHFYGSAPELVWHGSLASRRQVVFRYGAGSWLGYGSRTITYDPNLMWNPPAGFPTDRDWHLTDYREFRS